MQLFYNSEVSENDTSFSFNKDESRHISKVLRKKQGDKLYLTNGKGWGFECELITVEQKNCTALIKKKHIIKIKYIHYT